MRIKWSHTDYGLYSAALVLFIQDVLDMTFRFWNAVNIKFNTFYKDEYTGSDNKMKPISF
ncbi:hypothetical protein Echvi_1865 [Echinicola vietnamensis DSM 17526]|uniref:Uncharacterized protein n=1 Tax=Echinicola vietnamensis (strain DSM 17526 / LMG 23754 / KMM 6221) TaxID=926556 RepID=L0FZS0_ECHVK|nr:hypothetical protein Echvi_1865 [Echinicola vietnamensis DSM 17526]